MSSIWYMMGELVYLLQKSCLYMLITILSLFFQKKIVVCIYIYMMNKWIEVIACKMNFSFLIDYNCSTEMKGECLCFWQCSKREVKVSMGKYSYTKKKLFNFHSLFQLMYISLC